MVGRETELKYLQDALLTAIEEGEGQMVTIVGEAGVGKSRLLYEFQDWIELLPPPPVRFFEGRAHPEAQGLPYALLRDLFAFRFQIQDNDSAEAVREKLGAGFAEVFGTQADGEMHSHILGQWLGYDFSNSPHLKGVLNDAQQLRNRGRMYLGEYFRGLSAEAPMVIYLEDIHWADDSSLDAVNWMGERLHSQRLLVVSAARPMLFERRPYWGEGQTHHTRLDLRPLSRRESRQLVEQILQLAREIPPELRELVVEGAEGNPFYLEELIKMLIENGVVVKGEESWHIEPERLAQTEVPPTLAGVLQARLDSLPAPERTVLQQASVVGRLFWDRIVAYIQSAEEGQEDMVPDALTALRGRELIYRREASAFADAREYIFKHDILREVTYESVLKRLRKVYHGLVADWLIAQGTERAGEYYGLIAEHLLQAGRKEQASQYLTQAGEAALASYANGEAEANFRNALELSPDTTRRAACLAGLGETLARQGRREEAEQILRQAIDLYLEIGVNDRTAYLYTRLSQMLWHGDYQKAWEASQEGLRRLAGVADSPGLAYLLGEAGRTAYFRARPKEEIVPLLNQAIEMASSLEIVGPRAEASITLALAEGDPTQGIEILKGAAVICEAHGLLRSAGRAHFNLGHFYGLTLGGADKSFQSYLKAAEMGRQMGDMDQMILALGNALESWAQLGNLKSEQDFSMDFLRKSSASEAQLDEFLQKRDPSFSYYRGDWAEPLEHARAELQKLRKGGSLQFISVYNSYVAESILEMQRFTGEGSLVEAEAALQENIDMHWLVNQSLYLLAMISACKGLFQEAHERLSEASARPLNKLQEAQRLIAEAEIALAEGDWNRAVLACQSIIKISQAGEYRWYWARTLINLGDAFVGRSGPGDRERAQQAYRQSLEMVTEMGADGYIRVLEKRLREI
jgi:tetratricopeptide (TPR) repeat protein